VKHRARRNLRSWKESRLCLVTEPYAEGLGVEVVVGDEVDVFWWNAVNAKLLGD
jgi:hypothetical protein